MDVVHAIDARDIGNQVGADRARVELARRALEQDMSGIGDHLPAAPDDDGGDQDREQRIDRCPAGQQDHRAGESAATEPSRSPSTWTNGAAHVEIVAVGALKQDEGSDVHQEPEHGDDHHDAARDVGRGHQPLGGLIDDPGGDGEQREPVGKRDQHLEAVEAISAPPVGGTPRQPEAEPGKRERGEVGQHVAGVGEQR